MGNSSAEVVAKAKKILDALDACSPADAPYDLFNASTIERIFPWQLHPLRSLEAPLKLEMAGNDRRSLQLGITFNRKIE